MFTYGEHFTYEILVREMVVKHAQFIYPVISWKEVTTTHSIYWELSSLA